jgi:uncharacterized protein YdiU (UPF0061 family)
VTETDPLVEALNGFGPAYRRELMAAMLARLGVASRGDEEDAGLVQTAFAALAAGGERLGWEPFFFDAFCGRAPAGPRQDLNTQPEFAEFRDRLAGFTPDRPERLADPYFAQAEPEALLIDEIEAIWAAIADADDWRPFEAKLARIEAARVAWGLS